ncbi:hypothetical protein GCM10025784_31520 [Citricoccus nitrophenolicus]
MADRLPQSRLQCADVEHLGYGLYRDRAAPALTWADVGLDEPPHGQGPGFLRALLESTEGILSHQSAAHLYGIPLPPWLAGGPEGGHDEDDDRWKVQVTGPGMHLRSRREGVAGHRRRLTAGDVVVRHGLTCTSPERTWLDLAALFRVGQEEHLVVAGDHLVKHPWGDGGRRKPISTPARLRDALYQSPRFKGIRLARAALPHVRVGADSPTETIVRLRLVDAGLPEPDLQVHATELASDPYPADLGYREVRIALQYDGKHHLHPEQRAIDARRDAWFARHGWVVIRITAEDLQDDLRDVIWQIKVHLVRLAA